MKKALALLLLSGLACALFAASATEAVGPGQAREPWDGVRGGMAGAGEALVDRMTASPVAAARGAFNDKTAFLLSASYEEAAAERHGARRSLVFKAFLAYVAFCALVAVVFFAIGRPVIGLLPNGDRYADYWWAIPWLAAISALGSVQALYPTAETAVGRFRFLKWLLG